MPQGPVVIGADARIVRRQTIGDIELVQRGAVALFDQPDTKITVSQGILWVELQCLATLRNTIVQVTYVV